MISKREAKERINRWNSYVGGGIHQEVHENNNGQKFMKTTLFYYDTEQRLTLPEIKTKKQYENPYKTIIVDTFIHPL